MDVGLMLLRVKNSERQFYKKNILTICTLETPLGSMVAIADSETIYCLQFADDMRLQGTLSSLKADENVAISFERTVLIDKLDTQLQSYFTGDLTVFDVPLYIWGTDFQKKVWSNLRTIPLGHTRSYRSIAESVGCSLGYRATAQANRANKILIIIPCHRVIDRNGGIGGYSSGIERKKWLLSHEQQFLE